MKLPITNFPLRMPNIKYSPPVAAATRLARAAENSPFEIRHSKFERGIALVITLIMLSVTLVMAVAFLALARRERGSVSTRN